MFVLTLLLIFAVDATRLVTGIHDQNKDFVQIIVTAQAALAGVDPYLPLPDLTRRFQPEVSLDRLPHPSPYPPPSLLLGLPFAPLSYLQGIVAWLILGVLALIASLFILYRELGKKQMVGLALLLFAIWHPVFLDLGYAQVMLPVLLVSVLCWRSLRQGHDFAGGLFLGLLLAFKLFAWPVAVFLLLRRRWRAVLAAAGVVIAAHLVIALWVGFAPVAYYYLHVGSEVARLYRYDFANFSPLTIGSRLFEGIGSDELRVLPLISAPALAKPVSAIAMLAIVLWGLLLALRAKTFDKGFAAALCLSIVASPIAWRHYLVILALPVALIAAQTEWTRRRLVALAALVLLALPMGHIYQLLSDVLRHFANGSGATPAIGAVLGLAPLVLVLSVLKFSTSR